ncbi:MAG TPA: 5-(carboxyamino)imidazole ribonucleotide synthase, partial [Trueperaceae bacterium]|nr:5-(carboxyamino)imidazole ribonucleotide synthase [Trueperaceae bacterium]
MSPSPLAPGATIGIVGGGQLGRMLAATAQRYGYRVHVLSPEENPPAAVHADRHVAAVYQDVSAVAAFAAGVDVLTFEFENVSSEALAAAAALTVVRPSPEVLHVTQDRAREKEFLARNGFPVAPYRVVRDGRALDAAVADVGTPCMVKTAGFGYDGKGQVVLTDAAPTTEAAARTWAAARELAAAGPVVVERRIDLRLELSVVAARSHDGHTAIYAPIVNRHVDQVLDLSFTPLEGDSRARGEGRGAANEVGDVTLPRSIGERAAAVTARLVEALGLVGLCCVEFFLSTDGELLVNEIAPRPHNSGHLTIEASATDQFEQQLRAVCGLPLGDTRLLTPSAMANLLGDLWAAGTPDFAAALAVPGVTLHLYGKS